MRGARVPVQHLRARVGIIPAYAGSTACAATSGTRAWDHPRVCGEHPASTFATLSGKGSSPRMRGALMRHANPVSLERIIPAYAGSTACAATSGTRVWDHPRVCGEHTTKETMSNWELGSSPRMRGAPGGSLSSLILIGIIPAYAGSTRLRAMPAGARRDHPRVCGEHSFQKYHYYQSEGSSPRMRGARAREHPPPGRSGIIPAYAGSTYYWR